MDMLYYLKCILALLLPMYNILESMSVEALTTTGD